MQDNVYLVAGGLLVKAHKFGIEKNDILWFDNLAQWIRATSKRCSLPLRSCRDQSAIGHYNQRENERSTM